MGVSLQVYRVRIGSFQPTALYPRMKKSKENSGSISNWSRFKCAVLLLTIGCVFPVFVHLNQASFKSQTISCPTAPTTTACNPSYGPACAAGLPLIPCTLYSIPHQQTPLHPCHYYQYHGPPVLHQPNH